MSKRKYSGVNVNDGGDHKKIKIKASKAEDDCKPENDLKNTRIEDSKSNEHTSVENENNETSMFARKAKRRGNPNGQGKTARKKSLVNGSSVLVQDKLASKPVGRKVKADRRRKKGETKREEFSGETSKTNENSVVLDQENIASRLTERKPEGEWKEAPTKREEEQKEPVGENSNPEGGPSTVNEDKAARRVLSRSTKIDRKKKRKRAKLMEREMEREEQQNKPVDKKPTEKKAMKKEPVGDNSNVNGDPSGVIEDKVARKLALRKAKIERRRTKKAQEGELKIVTNDASKAQANSGQRKSKDKNKKRKTNSEENAHSWNISDPIGGQMMDLDPIFALNEEYLLIAYDSTINVYSIATSLLVRKLRVADSDRISSFALSTYMTNHLFVSTSLGSIERWDWVEGTRLELWNTATPIHRLVTADCDNNEEKNGLIYTIDKMSESLWMFTAHRLLGSTTDLGTLLKYRESLTSARAIENGRIIVLTSGSRVIIGTCESTNAEPLRDLTYSWRDVTCRQWITSVDVRIRSQESHTKVPPNQKSSSNGVIDIAVGMVNGEIVIYDNLLENLILKEDDKNSGQTTNVSSRRLHWHRNEVLALKWSADGNYLISGGLETVLVLWQLETGKKQFLPHLSATIESIVVSPSGSSYCIRLSDNSAMIISTSSLQPTFNVSDIKLPSVRKNSNQIPFIPSIDIPSQSLLPRQKLRFPAAVSPSVPGHLYLAVPSSTNLKSAKNFSNPACFLQTFDLSSSQQISHQAMTRTKTTIFNVGPEMNTVQDPNISYLQISHDCQWLATIDEWMPPIRDIAFLAFNREREAEEQASRREINLMIWSRNDDTKTWDLNSKIIDPHASSASMNHDVNIVFDLASDPSCPGFATVGNDYAVKVWKPSARVRHGTRVRDNNGKGLINWSCRHITQLEVSSHSSVRIPQGAKLAYSQDGSVLAVGYRLSAPATIYLIDPTTGIVQRTLTGLYAAPLYGLGILDQYLITLSEELRIWNLITEEQQYAFDLKPQGLSVENTLNATHLAVNARQANFAITFPGLGRNAKNETKQKSQIIIFDPRDPSPLFFTSTFNIATTLLPGLNQKGYYVIDSVAEVKILSPNTPPPPTTTLAIEPSSENEEAPPRGLERIYGNANNSSTALKASNDGEDDQTITSPVAPEFTPASETDSGNVVIPSHKITELFRSNPMPPLTELFERVAELCNGREST